MQMGTSTYQYSGLLSNAVGDKRYELSNHLGNVLQVVSDSKLPGGLGASYTADVKSYSDYYPFGMQLPGWHGSEEEYRYGFNGMEKDDEAKGNGNSYTTEFRQYDPRLGRWLSIDPLMDNFPWQSPYVAFDNNPIYYNDPLGGASQPYFWGIILEAIKGGFIGGGSEFAFQAADNMIFEGMDFDVAIREVDWSDISVEALNGAIQEMIPFNAYATRKMREMFTGKYRKMTMYLIKQGMEGIQEMLNNSLKNYLNGEKINLSKTLESVLGESVVGEIMSAKPFINSSFTRKSSKINKLTDDAKKLSARISDSQSKLKNVVDMKSKEKIQKHILNLEKSRAKKMDRATDILAKQYTNFVGGETSEKILERAKGKINEKVYEGVITIGPLDKQTQE